MSGKFPKKETEDESIDLLDAEELPEDSKDQPGLLTRSTPGSSDSASGVDPMFKLPEDASSAESHCSESATGAIPKHPSSASPRARISKSCSPASRHMPWSPPASSDSTSGVDVRCESSDGASSSTELRSGESATGAIPKHRTSVPLACSDGVGHPESSPRRKRSHSTSSIGSMIKSAAAAIKSTIVSPRFRRRDAASEPGGDTTLLMVEDNEWDYSVDEGVESKKLSDNEAEEKMDVSPNLEADVDDPVQGACGGSSKEQVDAAQPEVIEMQVSTASSSEGSNLSDEKRRLTGTKTETLKDKAWYLESANSSLPGTASTSVESLTGDDSEGVDSYEEAQIQGRRRQRENDSDEDEEMDHGGPVKRLAVERRDGDDDEGPSAEGLPPLPSVERLI